MTYLGIDPSTTSTGFVMLRKDGLVVHAEAHKPKKLTGIARAETHADALLQVLGKYGAPDVVAIETPFTSRNPKTFALLVEVQTLLRYVLFKRKIDTVLVQPTVLKKWVGVKAKKGAGKDPVRSAVKEMYGFGHAVDDVVDAYVLARIAQARRDQSHCTVEAQRDILAKLTWLQ